MQIDSNPAYSPDGKRIAFVSARSGSSEIWLSDSDGTNPRKLTALNARIYAPKWSPDSRKIAFHALPQGSTPACYYVIGADGGVPRKFTPVAQLPRNSHPSWSYDGSSIYFSSAHTGATAIWRIPAEGGSAVRMTSNGGYHSAASRDGKFLYFDKSNYANAGVWRVPAEGGKEVLVLETGTRMYWDLTEGGICWFGFDAADSAGIHFFSFATNRSTKLLDVPNAPAKYALNVGGGISMSRDGRWVLYTQLDRDESDLMLVENFR